MVLFKTDEEKRIEEERKLKEEEKHIWEKKRFNGKVGQIHQGLSSFGLWGVRDNGKAKFKPTKFEIYNDKILIERNKQIIQLSQIKENIINLNKRRKALKLLEEMLFSINKKNDDIFQSLSKEARILYNHITGKNLSDDGIIMSGFDKDKIMVADKQNKIRNVEFLSSATRDAVYIAMRLSILTKIHQAGRLILLDDPFITFDNNRTKEALSFIKEYSKNYNIPVVIFTKDTFTRDFMQKFEDVTIYELS